MNITVWTDENNIIRGSQQGPADVAVDENGYTSHIAEFPGEWPDPETKQLIDGAIVDADPAVLASVFLANRKNAAIVALWSEIDNFIQRKPNGRPRYDHNFKAAANALLVGGLTGDPLAKYQAVFAWINAVWAVYHAAKAAIDGAATLADLDAVTWDLSPYEVGAGGPEEDPGVGLSELLT